MSTITYTRLYIEEIIISFLKGYNISEANKILVDFINSNQAFDILVEICSTHSNATISNSNSNVAITQLASTLFHSKVNTNLFYYRSYVACMPLPPYVCNIRCFFSILYTYHTRPLFAYRLKNVLVS